MKKRLLIKTISSCYDCDHCLMCGVVDVKYHCRFLDKKITESTKIPEIPEWCPLEEEVK